MNSIRGCCLTNLEVVLFQFLFEERGLKGEGMAALVSNAEILIGKKNEWAERFCDVVKVETYNELR